ncbi:division abnormally delayed protein-like isoform X1 [Limulus polyphemus]|uniref:Division abnormally delayed protein-like isoform X1 n=1 Tax=Limulus polyphemus TaxID=6850 RepID=A0ABM1SGF8_LIMPO|nr:division abnormally delayed protein-like isoform X1 [Limulus polyphemus]
MIDDHNIEKVLSMMDTKITESLMYAMEHGPELTARVQTHCGHHRRSEKPTHSSIAVSNQTNVISQATSIKFEPKLNQRLQVFLQKLADFKGYYGNLADSVCNDRSWASQDEVLCWNGYKLGEYKKTIAGMGVGAQKYNPEITLTESHDSMTVTLVDKLMRMRELLDRQITRIPKSESQIVWNEAGSGERRRIWEESSVHDDEDYYYFGSGNGRLFGTFFKNYEHFISSGSGDNDPLYSGQSPGPTTGDANSETSRTDTDIQFDNEEKTPPHGDPKDKKDNAADGVHINAALLPLVILTVVIHYLGQLL